MKRTAAVAVATTLGAAALVGSVASDPSAAHGLGARPKVRIEATSEAKTPGSIVFTAKVGAHTQLFTIAPDGEKIRQMTHFTDSDAQNANWSPDGTQIVFERDFPTVDTATRAGIYTIDSHGDELRSLTPRSSVYETVPAFAPDGKEIVFNHDNGTRDEIWTMTSTGTNRRQVTPTNPKGTQDHFEDLPRFSPNGRQIVFVNEIGSRAAVFLVNSDGSGVRQVTSYALGAAGRVDWSPDGTRILFSSGAPGAASNLYTTRPDGHDLSQLTHNPPGTNSIAGSWSPDGRQLVYTRISPDSEDLYILNANGTKPTQLTHNVAITYGHGGAWGAKRV